MKYQKLFARWGEKKCKKGDVGIGLSLHLICDNIRLQFVVPNDTFKIWYENSEDVSFNDGCPVFRKVPK